jgi:hypothetical protein
LLWCLISLVNRHMDKPAVLLLLAFAPIVLAQPPHNEVPTTQPAYVHVTMCGIDFHRGKTNPKYISLEAEYINAIPHGVILIDWRCRRGLSIDFAETGLDAGAATMKDKFLLIRRATGTFRGVLNRNRNSGRLGITVQSVLNLQSKLFYPEEEIDPIRLPEPQWPMWPPAK